MKGYKASAGSGKTYTLAKEYIKELLKTPDNHPHRHILAVTFTKDATGEMKDRILAELYGLAFNCKDSAAFLSSVQESLAVDKYPMKSEEIQRRALKILEDILHDYSRLHITTIDSFFQKVLRNLARELGKGSKFNLEMNSTKVLSDAVHAMIENAHENEQLLNWLTTYIEERLEENTNWRIETDILKFSKCIFDEFFQEHEQILKSQLKENPQFFEQIWNFHKSFQKDCRNFFKETYRQMTFSIEQNNLSINDFSRSGTVIKFLEKLASEDFSNANSGSATVQDCCVDAEKWTSKSNKRKNDIVALAASQYMPLLNQTMEKLREYNTSRMITKNIYQLGLIWDIIKEIEQQNADNNRFMLADTALFLNQMIDDSDAPFIYEKIGSEIRHVMIDEFQDTSRLQWKNFKSLLTNIIAENKFSLIVGDVKQSIYRWRNGDWNILNNIQTELQGIEMETLEYNFRSESEIIDFNNRLFLAGSASINEKYVNRFGNESESPFVSAYASENVIQKTRKKEDRGFVSIDFINNDNKEISYKSVVLEQLLSQLLLLKEKGIEAEQICILTRNNGSIIEIAEFLSAQKIEHPELLEGNYCNIISNEAFQLSSSPAIRIIIEALKVLSDPDNPIPKAQLRIFLKQMNQSEISLPDILSNDSETLSISSEQLNQLPLFELIGHLYRSFQLEKIEGQSNYLFTFYDSITNYLKDNSTNISGFLNYWEDDLKNKTVSAGTAVKGIRAMTIHKSKGLQFHTVIVPFCDWEFTPGATKSPTIWCGSKEGLYDLELLPVKYSNDMYETVFLPEYELETKQLWMDNLNVLYVAFTRAECNLFVISKYAGKLDSVEKISTSGNLIQYVISELGGSYDADTLHFEKGTLFNSGVKKSEDTDNLLKQTPGTIDINFISKPFNTDKEIFKQSNKSREFISSDEKLINRNEYIQKGNVMHYLFSHIHTMKDISKAVNNLCMEGLIPQEKKSYYIDYLTRTIKESGHEDWFSENIKVYNECTLLVKENGIMYTQRPDRVLIKENEVIVIDYKFGEEHAAHQKQIEEYVQLMKKMGHNNVKGHVWYVEQ